MFGGMQKLLGGGDALKLAAFRTTREELARKQNSYARIEIEIQVAAMRVRLDEIYRIRGFIISPTSGFMDVWDFFLVLGLVYTSVGNNTKGDTYGCIIIRM